MESGPRPAAEVVVPYAALVMQVELLAGSELRHGAATQLERRGWALSIDPMEDVRYLKSSSPEALLCMEREKEEGASGTSSRSRCHPHPDPARKGSRGA